MSGGRCWTHLRYFCVKNNKAFAAAMGSTVSVAELQDHVPQHVPLPAARSSCSTGAPDPAPGMVLAPVLAQDSERYPCSSTDSSIAPCEQTDHKQCLSQGRSWSEGQKLAMSTTEQAALHGCCLPCPPALLARCCPGLLEVTAEERWLTGLSYHHQVFPAPCLPLVFQLRSCFAQLNL